MKCSGWQRPWPAFISVERMMHLAAQYSELPAGGVVSTSPGCCTTSVFMPFRVWSCSRVLYPPASAFLGMLLDVIWINLNTECFQSVLLCHWRKLREFLVSFLYERFADFPNDNLLFWNVLDYKAKQTSTFLDLKVCCLLDAVCIGFLCLKSLVCSGACDWVECVLASTWVMESLL